MSQPSFPIDVRNRFDGSWSSGFEVVETAIHPCGSGSVRYRVRRVMDGVVIPEWFGSEDVSWRRDDSAALFNASDSKGSPATELVAKRTITQVDVRSARGVRDEWAIRDRRADARDWEADMRDVAAATRDDDAAGDGESDILDLARAQSAVDRKAAASDRDQSRVDREAAAEERTKASKEIVAAVHDDLTAFLLRRAGLEELERDMARSRRSGAPLSVAFLDVDGLKEINDVRGHAAGDEAIRAIADAIRATMRTYDVMVRFGGDEFLVAALGMAMPELEARVALMGVTLARGPEPISISSGLAELQAGDTVDSVIARADKALYRKRRKHPRSHNIASRSSGKGG
jgi:diguanylate cyclase (GGDEF)-like protein